MKYEYKLVFIEHVTDEIYGGINLYIHEYFLSFHAFYLIMSCIFFIERENETYKEV